ncbi:MAG: sensor histidine kinase [Spirochaetales bacterium]|nr:sensor histidine kinase [Spirochaetales bacterium]
MTKIRLSNRIILFFTVLISISLIISGFFFNKIFTKFVENMVKENSMQTVTSIGENIKTILDSVNNYSKVILANDEVQLLLKSPNGYAEIDLRDSVNQTMSSIVSNVGEISSIYIIDCNNHKYYSESLAFNYLYFNSIYSSNVWSSTRELKGASHILNNGGDIFRSLTVDDFISNVRVINNIETQSEIGAILINTSHNFLKNSFSKISTRYGTKIYIFDENKNLITSSQHYSKDSFYNDVNCVYSTFNIEKYGWDVVTITSLQDEKSFLPFFLSTIISLIILASLIFTGSFIITKIITEPVNILTESIEKTGKGNFNKVEYNSFIQDFNILKNGYNTMVSEIEYLIQSVISKEESKRKAELISFQSQIKPHFLYNTFDSISSLALMGDSEKVYQMVTSLGNFYRISLSKGNEIITFKDELDALESYIKILQMRYNNFDVEYDLDEELLTLHTLKLIIQPFVENSIYHGIKPKSSFGLILIAVKKNENKIKISISDNGIGMKSSKIDTILLDRNSFGISGTIERIKLYYGNNSSVIINSELNVGTLVEITIPENVTIYG